MPTVTMTMEEYLQLINGLSSDMSLVQGSMPPQAEEKPKKKRSTAYQRRYKASFRKIQDQYKKNNGEWRKNGFKRAVKAAHDMAGKK